MQGAAGEAEDDLLASLAARVIDMVQTSHEKAKELPRGLLRQLEAPLDLPPEPYRRELERLYRSGLPRGTRVPRDHAMLAFRSAARPAAAPPRRARAATSASSCPRARLTRPSSCTHAVQAARQQAPGRGLHGRAGAGHQVRQRGRCCARRWRAHAQPAGRPAELGGGQGGGPGAPAGHDWAAVWRRQARPAPAALRAAGRAAGAAPRGGARHGALWHHRRDHPAHRRAGAGRTGEGEGLPSIANWPCTCQAGGSRPLLQSLRPTLLALLPFTPPPPCPARPAAPQRAPSQDPKQTNIIALAHAALAKALHQQLDVRFVCLEADLGCERCCCCAWLPLCAWLLLGP